MGDREERLANDGVAGFSEQEETSSLDNVEWTDEKHSLYLKSMEASFVNQLYNLKDLFRFDDKLCRQGSSSGSSQIKVQDHCQWPNKFRKTSPQPDVADGSEECSDQNFINEDCENRTLKRKRAKRLRTLDASSETNNDQVVPFGLSCLPMQDRNEGCSSMQDRTLEQGGQSTKTEHAF